MTMNLNDIIRYRGRSFQLATSCDPSTSMVTAILSLDHRVIDTYIDDGSEGAPPPTDSEFQTHLDDAIRGAHRHLHQSLLDGNYDPIVDSVTPPDKTSSRRSLSSDEFVAVDQGPEAFATPTRELPVLNTINQRITTSFKERPSPPPKAAKTRIADPSSTRLDDITSHSSSFPRLSAEPSEAYDSSPGSPSSTLTGAPSNTLTTSPSSSSPPPAEGPEIDFFAWAKQRRLEAATWHRQPHEGWTPISWTTETSPPLLDQQCLPDYWQRWSHHLQAITGDLDGRISVLIQNDQALLILHNAPFMTVVAAPLELMGLALSAAHRIIDPS